jgi:hypothetical protein
MIHLECELKQGGKTSEELNIRDYLCPDCNHSTNNNPQQAHHHYHQHSQKSPSSPNSSSSNNYAAVLPSSPLAFPLSSYEQQKQQNALNAGIPSPIALSSYTPKDLQSIGFHFPLQMEEILAAGLNTKDKQDDHPNSMKSTQRFGIANLLN